MKKTILSTFALLLAVSAFAQQGSAISVNANGPALTFTEQSYDFGDIEQGDKVSHVFEFKNTGTEPVVITRVHTLCGCTVPDYPKEPIMPGQKSSMTVTFNSAGKIGRQNKVVTVFSNAPDARVTITSNVLKATGR